VLLRGGRDGWGWLTVGGGRLPTQPARPPFLLSIIPLT